MLEGCTVTSLSFRLSLVFLLPWALLYNGEQLLVTLSLALLISSTDFCIHFWYRCGGAATATAAACSAAAAAVCLWVRLEMLPVVDRRALMARPPVVLVRPLFCMEDFLTPRALPPGGGTGCLRLLLGAAE